MFTVTKPRRSGKKRHLNDLVRTNGRRGVSRVIISKEVVEHEKMSHIFSMNRLLATKPGSVEEGQNETRVKIFICPGGT